MSAKAAIAALYSRDRLQGYAQPDGFDELREAIEVLVPTRPGWPPNARKLGNQLRGFKDRIVGGSRLAHKTKRGICGFRLMPIT